MSRKANRRYRRESHERLGSMKKFYNWVLRTFGMGGSEEEKSA